MIQLGRSFAVSGSTHNAPPGAGASNSPAALPSREECERVVARIAASHLLRRSARLRDFLVYVCRQVLEHQTPDIKEHQIGVEVFDRPVHYDTSQDNIVRVNASELRKRLDRYFSSDGAAEAVVIELPKGGYTPVFRYRQAEAWPVRETGREPPRSRTVRLLAALALLLAAACSALLVENAHLRTRAPAFHSTPALRALWSALAPEKAKLDLVLADSAFSLYQDIVRRPVSLQDYLDRRLPIEPALDFLPARRYTSVADVALLRRILALTAGRQETVDVHFTRDYSAQALKKNNVVLIGSPRSNPWAGLFESRMTFRFEYDEEKREARIRNRGPRAGEPHVYEIGRGASGAQDSIAIAAFLPNPSGTGHVLILVGAGIQGTDAAGDFVTSEPVLSRFLQQAGIDVRRTPPHFEVLLRAGIMAGTANRPEVVAFRLYNE